jgi:NADH-quinone oxidoreductase subunit J
MDITAILFWLFSAILIGAGLRVITAQNPVHAALALVLCFFQAAFIWMLLKAEFLAITLILVYVGAVMVLFLFVVMMLDIGPSVVRQGFKRHLLMGSALAGVLVFEIAAIVIKGFYKPLDNLPAPLRSGTIGQTKVLGLEMFTHYAFAVEVASVILLVAVVAAVALTLRRRKDVKYNDPQAAIRTQAKDRVRVIKMAAVLPVINIDKINIDTTAAETAVVVVSNKGVGA